MANPRIEADPVLPPRSAVSQLLWLYLIVSATVAISWFLGNWNFSCLWVFGMIFGLFIVWRTRLHAVVERNLEWHKEHFNRKRALRQEETAEWLNFIINRWWVFSSGSIENLVRRRINERLLTVAPSFLDSNEQMGEVGWVKFLYPSVGCLILSRTLYTWMADYFTICKQDPDEMSGNTNICVVGVTHQAKLELAAFTFGDITPNVRSVKVFECADGSLGFKPASWSAILQPPQGLHKMSTYQVVLEADIASRCEDFRMVFRARVGGEKVGLSFDVAVEEMRVKGTAQVILHMSMEAPFPHVSKATISFKELPEVWFNVRVLKALQLMEIPLLKSWIHINVMEGLTKALVDPGKIDIMIASVGPVNAQLSESRTKQPIAQGVLTVQINGVPSPSAGDDIYYTRLRLGKSKRQTGEFPANQQWEDCCSFFVHDLIHQQLNIKSKCKRLLTTVTLEQHDLDLSSFPFQLTKIVNHEVVNNDGSKLNLHMDYTPLPVIDLTEPHISNILQKSGVLYVCVHNASNVIASDRTGSSDPYCVVFCDRRRVLTTPYVAQTRNPQWDCHTEFFVKDYSQCTLAFYVFDWDGSTQLDDDFLGSTSLNMTEPCVLHKPLLLGYNKQGQGHVEDRNLGQITVSVVFRSVPSVEKSERLRLSSTDSQNNHLYIEDQLVSPGSMHIVPSQLSAIDDYQTTQKARIQSIPVRSGRKSKAKKRIKSVKRSTGTANDALLKDKILVDLTILQGKDLVAKDRNGFSDPFCEVYVDDKKLFSTSVKKKTLSPMWNESVTFQMTEDCGPIEIELFDKDIISHDFMGKVSLSLEQLKELSLKGYSEWYTVEETESGAILLACTVTTKDTLDQEEAKRSKARSSRLSSSRQLETGKSNRQSDPSRDVPDRMTSLDSDVFESPATSPDSASRQVTKRLPEMERNGSAKEIISKQNALNLELTPLPKTPVKNEIRRNSLEMVSPLHPNDSSLITSTPLQQEEREIRIHRSQSDVKLAPRSRRNSANSMSAFPSMDLSTDENESSNVEKTDMPIEVSGVRSRRRFVQGRRRKGMPQDKLYNVKGRIMSVHGLKINIGNIYCKVRALAPHRHRLKQIFGSRVIAKSPMMRASEPVCNIPFDVDRGLGISGETLLKFDVKCEDGKQHLASKAYSIKSLFNGPGGEGDKIQKVLPLENSLMVEVFLQHSPRDFHRQSRFSSLRRDRYSPT